ncbi:transcriptional regulator [Vibrio sp.]|nr:transcriptional regulator [Vibrio sp.]
MKNTELKYAIGDRFIFSPTSNTLIDKAESDTLVRLGSNESRILLLLLEKQNEVVSRKELHEFVWRDQGFEVDDSSLTQAISTLRKMLKDPTKAPQFVKTVPKRGYQLIASITAIEPGQEIETPAQVIAVEAPVMPNIDMAQTHSQMIKPTVAMKKPSPMMTLWSKLVLIGAMILPIVVYNTATASKSELKPITVINGINIVTTASQSDLSNVLPLIEQCITSHQSDNEEKPADIIVTGSETEHLYLNYIYSKDQSDKNHTIRVVTDAQSTQTACGEESNV